MGARVKTVLLVISALLSLASVVLSFISIQQASLMVDELDAGQLRGIEPSAVAGGLKISMIPAILPLIGLVISLVLIVQKRKLARLVFVANLMALAICLLLGFSVFLWR